MKYDKIISSVCAIGYSHFQFEAKPEYAEKLFKTFDIIGTGFLIDNNIVLTNKHIIHSLNNLKIEKLFENNNFMTQFVYPISENTWSQTFSKIIDYGEFPGINLDVGFIKINLPSEVTETKCTPIELVKDFAEITLAKKVAVIGFPSGNSLLFNKDVDLFRFGPLIQQGYISAIAPYANVKTPERYMLDINGMGGMSGSPVIEIDEGRVFAIYYAGNQATTGITIPINIDTINKWIGLIRSN